MSPNTYESHFGERIIAERKALGLTQETLGVAANVSKATVSKWERGDTKNMRPAHLFAIADALRVEPRWLALKVGPKSRGPVVSVSANGHTVELPTRRLALIQAYGDLPAEIRQPIRMLIEILYRVHHPAAPTAEASPIAAVPADDLVTMQGDHDGRRRPRK